MSIKKTLELSINLHQPVVSYSVVFYPTRYMLMISKDTLALPNWAAVCLLMRRLAAMFYDSLLLTGLLFVASVPFTVLNGGAIADGNLGFRLYLLTIIFIYLGWQWTHGGQTLGMKAWHLQAVSHNHTPLDWRLAGLRFLAALLSTAAAGLGYIWLLIDRDRLAWHDRLSGTRLIKVDGR